MPLFTGPEDGIRMEIRKIELAQYSREDLIYDLEKLQE